MLKNNTVVLACRDYDRTRRIIDGTVKRDGLQLQISEMTDVANTFTNMFNGKYDISEFSLGELVYHVSRGKKEFIGIPVFPLRMFRHGWIFINSSSGINTPYDLDKKRIGLYRLAQTACIWIRGLLADEYGVSPSDTYWYLPSIHHWQDDSEKETFQSRDGSTIRWLPRAGPETNIKVVDAALVNGEVDAVCSAVRPPSFVQGDPRVKRLVEKYDEAERSYYRKTKIFPIMHTLAVKSSIVEANPELPGRIFEMFVEAKNRAWQWLRGDGSIGLMWKDRYMEEELELQDDDPWIYGLRANEHVIQKFLDYCYAQGVSASPLKPQDLFVPATWDFRDHGF
jgi:4,5-dihydroxyphthalate decarboxylase